MGERKTEMIEIEVHEKLNRFNFRPTLPIFGQLCQFRDVSTFHNSGLKANLRESSFIVSVTTFRFYFSSETHPYSIVVHYIDDIIISLNHKNYRISEKFIFKFTIEDISYSSRTSWIYHNEIRGTYL